MALFLFYESPGPEAAQRELPPQTTYLAGSQLAESKSAKCTPDGCSVISPATSKEGGGLPSRVLDVDCPLRGRSRGRFTASPRH